MSFRGGMVVGSEACNFVPVGRILSDGGEAVSGPGTVFQVPYSPAWHQLNTQTLQAHAFAIVICKLLNELKFHRFRAVFDLSLVRRERRCVCSSQVCRGEVLFPS